MREKNPLFPQLPPRVMLGAAADASNVLLDLLRQFGMRQQRDVPQPFPSVREVASHFKVSVSAVARIYAKLEREGLLTRVRGSHTVLKGREFGRRLHVRAVVGLPASLFCFITLQHYRQFLENMRRELARRDFAAAHVFFRPEHVRDNTLADRLTGKGVDAVVWYLPDRGSERTLACLKDRGVPVVGVCDGGFPVTSCRYTIRRRPALRTILRNWAASGVTCVTIVTEPLKRSAPDEERWQQAVEEQRIPVDIATLHDERVANDIRDLDASRERGVIFLASAASLAASRAPDALLHLMTRCRVALPDGPLTLLFTRRVPAMRVDIVTVNWRKLATRIVSDLISQSAFAISESVEFSAEPHIQAMLSDYAEEI